MWANVLVMGMADGPTEIHQMYAARHLLRKHKPAPGRFPTDYIPELRRQAQEKFAKALEPAE